MNRDRVRGMYLGIAIGDALGMATEGLSVSQIRECFPHGIRQYEPPSKEHKWFQGKNAGTWTDDTQLTLATSRALVQAKGFDMDSIAEFHVEALRQSLEGVKSCGGSGVPGWGRTTANAIRNIANNVHWSRSGFTEDCNSGHGNGVVMKVAPLAAWLVSPFARRGEDWVEFKFYQKMVSFSEMTHYTKKSAIAAIVHIHNLAACMMSDAKTYDPIVEFNEVFRSMYDFCQSEMFDIFHLYGEPEDIFGPLNLIEKNLTPEEIANRFGNGSCNIAHSLPFTYCYWLNYHDSVELLYSLAEAGGDTDTNASIAGGMLGALRGTAIFPEHLVKNLFQSEMILREADRFCDTFGIVN